MIKNKPRKETNDVETLQLRAASINRGKWVFQIAKEGLKAGMKWDDIREAIHKAGAYKGYNDFLRTSDIKKFAKAFATESLIKTNDAEIPVLTDDEFVWEVNYCPLVEGWLEFTEDQDFLENLCEACMEVDRGAMDTYGWTLELKETIARGDGKCTICMRRK